MSTAPAPASALVLKTVGRGLRPKDFRAREERVRKCVAMGLGTPNRRRMRRNKEREITSPMEKKFEKMKSLSTVRRLPFLGAFDLGLEDGRIEEAQAAPRREEEGMFGMRNWKLGCAKKEVLVWFWWRSVRKQ